MLPADVRPGRPVGGRRPRRRYDGTGEPAAPSTKRRRPAGLELRADVERPHLLPPFKDRRLSSACPPTGRPGGRRAAHVRSFNERFAPPRCKMRSSKIMAPPRALAATTSASAEADRLADGLCHAIGVLVKATRVVVRRDVRSGTNSVGPLS